MGNTLLTTSAGQKKKGKLLLGMILSFVFFIGCANQEEKIQDIKGNGMPDALGIGNVSIVGEDGLSFSDKMLFPDSALMLRGEAVNGERVEESGEEYYGKRLGLDWECTYVRVENVPHADAVNEQIKSEVVHELESLKALSKYYPADNIEADMMGSNGRAWIWARISAYEIIYQSDRYLAIGTTIRFRPLWNGDAQFNRKDKIMCFNLEKGERVRIEDITGEEYTEEELKELVWIGYERLVEKEGNKYNRSFFEQYYENLSDWHKEFYTGIPENDGYEEKALDEYVHYYFSEEGMVFYFNNYWAGIPAESGDYVAGNRLDDPEETELRICIPWEYIKQRQFLKQEEDSNEDVDRGAESPLAVYAGEQLGRKIEGCHEADYDQDGKNEVIFSVEIERTDEKELDRLEIYFVDDDYEMILIDTHEVGRLLEDLTDREEPVWDSEGAQLRDYQGVPVFLQNFL